MKCLEMQELLPDLASGRGKPAADAEAHIRNCAVCRNKLEEFRKTMALLDEWHAVEPSNYFDVRLHARLREEQTCPPARRFAWIGRPAMALAATLLIAAGVGLFRPETYPGASSEVGNSLPAWRPEPPRLSMAIVTTPGTAVSDLVALEKNNELYADFEVLDELEVQPSVTANP
jgi:anti-sigma factor RsiW